MNRDNEGDLYSESSNLSIVVLMISKGSLGRYIIYHIFKESDYVPISLDTPNIKHPCLLFYPGQSLRKNYGDSILPYRDYSYFLDSLWLEKEYDITYITYCFCFEVY
jgi:hypothetical protein